MEIEITERCEALLAELMRLVAVANRRLRRRYIYNLRYENGVWIHLARRGYAFDGWTDIIPMDTKATEENLAAGVAAMRNEITKEN